MNELLDELNRSIETAILMTRHEAADSSALRKSAQSITNKQESDYKEILIYEQQNIRSAIEILKDGNIGNEKIKKAAIILAQIVAIKCSVKSTIQGSPVNEFEIIKYLSKEVANINNGEEILETIFHLNNTVKSLSLNEDKDFYLDIYSKLNEKQTQLNNTIKETETKAKEHENKISNLIATLNKTLNNTFNNLEQSFKDFSKTKKNECRISLGITFLIGLLTLITAYISLSETGVFSTLINEPTNNALKISNRAIALIIIEILLIYFFRISLHNYYTARDELLQLNIRATLCRFAPIYATFSENKESKLQDFARHIFSPLAPKNVNTPQPTDFITQIVDSIKNTQNKTK
ncbi:hypothetical protein LN040_03975 [Desulfovibrio subterraneus]|uniref:hypothetical protein n=1 Tax=Desulfovibrio subterraneus TaxID=2718620 RepID=UPI0022B89D13|nr:hypothetical protein [Desulfovibrio subterraneus]WBF68272.1 hypothetical protein LN040_03975 [Desulfovibrio subterraneus]